MPLEISGSHEIEDLAKAGPFNSQVHSLGPTLFYNFGGDEDEATGGNDDPKAKASGEEQAIEPVAMAFSMNECGCPVWTN
jgi:hypothetical protein